ncbi:MAG: hypothetical protein R3F59_35895 [Myxococcota bacterium]
MDPLAGPTSASGRDRRRDRRGHVARFAVVFRPAAVAGLATEGETVVDPDGTGLLSSPLGSTLTLRTLTFDGGGLLSSPLGSNYRPGRPRRQRPAV